MKQPKIPCPTCDGNGTILLHEALFRTLEKLRSLKKATAPELWRASNERNIGATAFNNRMAELLSLGLVERVRDGKAWLYRIKEAK